MKNYIYNKAPNPQLWQHPHSQFIDKWQVGDVTYDDYYNWAEWLINQHVDDSDKLAEQLLFLCLDETDNSEFLRQANSLVVRIFKLLNQKNTQLAIPKYGFADCHYALDITEPYFQQLIAMVDETQLTYIAKLDHGRDKEEHLQALKQTIYQQNGKIDYTKQGSWYPDEVISLGQYYCENGFEIGFCVCNIENNVEMLVNRLELIKKTQSLLFPEGRGAS